MPTNTDYNAIGKISDFTTEHIRSLLAKEKREFSVIDIMRCLRDGLNPGKTTRIVGDVMRFLLEKSIIERSNHSKKGYRSDLFRIKDE
jgi:hypothetical protein